MAGADVPVPALLSDVTTQGEMLVLIRTKDIPISDEHVAHAQALWDLAAAHRDACGRRRYRGSRRCRRPRQRPVR
jgi:hypothetical protein